ncbi:MAG: formyltetrahydrofolate deformylase [Candidatus Omnitrophota bacterium]
MNTFILLFQCRDQKGIVARVSEFILKHQGNIITADQYSTDPDAGYFVMRVEFNAEQASKATLDIDFVPVAKQFGADWHIYDKAETLRMGILVSDQGHCLADILYLWGSGELKADIPFVLSNCSKHEKLVKQYNLPFYYLPADKDNRREEEILARAVKETDFLVLARYMLVFSGDFLRKYSKDIINIHHGFLPSFKGADPYGKALEEGVKVIGATAHFVNEKLDEGPIIAQEVESVSHKDNRDDLVRKGRNLEKKALANALFSYLDHRIIRHGNKTIVF